MIFTEPPALPPLMDDPRAGGTWSTSAFVELGRGADDGGARARPRPRSRRLHEARHARARARPPEIRMAIPFSAVPTPYRVEAAGRSWFANCAWDSFGILRRVRRRRPHLETSCPDCGEPIEIDVVDRRPSRAGRATSSTCLVPAAQLVGRHRLHLKHDEPLPVGRARGALAVETTGRAPGATISSEKLCELAHAWHATHLAPDWRPRTRRVAGDPRTARACAASSGSWPSRGRRRALIRPVSPERSMVPGGGIEAVEGLARDGDGGDALSVREP